jgi:hypothetical protein
MKRDAKPNKIETFPVGSRFLLVSDFVVKKASMAPTVGAVVVTTDAQVNIVAVSSEQVEFSVNGK